MVNQNFILKKIFKTIKKIFDSRAGWMMGGGMQKDKKFVNKIINQLLNGKKEIFIVDDKMEHQLILWICQKC